MEQPGLGTAGQVSATTRRPVWLTIGVILQRAAQSFSEDRGTHMAAAIAYYAAFSLFPLVTLVVSIFGIVLRDDARRERVVQALVDALPVEALGVGESLHTVAERGPTLTLVAGLVTLWSASALLSAVRRSLSVTFNVRGLPMLRAKALDFALVPVVGVAFLASLMITTSWRLLQGLAEGELSMLSGRFGWAWDLGALALPPVLAFLAFLFAYRVLPGRPFPLRYLWGGALFATVGFELIKQVFALYVTRFARYDLIYGSLGGLVALLFWVYLSANILIFGAEMASETAHLFRGEPRHGRAASMLAERDWRAAVWDFLVGLIMAPGEAGPAEPPESDEASANTHVPR